MHWWTNHKKIILLSEEINEEINEETREINVEIKYIFEKQR